MEKTFEVLNRLVSDGIIGRYAVGGAMGAMFYTEPVSTFDLDIFVILPRLESGLLTLGPLYEHLRSLHYDADGEFISIEGVPVQFLPAYNALVEEGLIHSTIQMYGSTSVSVLSAEYLIAIAIQTGRDKDRVRVRMLMEEAEIDIQLLDDILERYSLNLKGDIWMK